MGGCPGHWGPPPARGREHPRPGDHRCLGHFPGTAPVRAPLPSTGQLCLSFPATDATLGVGGTGREMRGQPGDRPKSSAFVLPTPLPPTTAAKTTPTTRPPAPGALQLGSEGLADPSAAEKVVPGAGPGGRGGGPGPGEGVAAPCPQASSPSCPPDPRSLCSRVPSPRGPQPQSLRPVWHLAGQGQ